MKSQYPMTTHNHITSVLNIFKGFKTSMRSNNQNALFTKSLYHTFQLFTDTEQKWLSLVNISMKHKW